MFRKLLLPAAGLLAASLMMQSANGRPEEPFGVLRGSTSSPPNPTKAPGLPAGIEADGPKGGAPTYYNPYPLTREAGAWLICAAHYGGPDGFGLAKQVADILRNKHRMAAYILNRGDEERRKQDAEWEALKKKYPGVALRRRVVRIEDQFAVLIGGYKDCAAATAALPRVRALPMPPLKLDGGRTPYERVHYTEETPDKKGMVVRSADINPFTQAMAVHNPLVPAEARQKWDPFWKKLNADEEYSLLKNRKKYTLIVKEYFGSAEVQSGPQGGPKPTKPTGVLGALGFGSTTAPGDALSAGQAQAHELAKFLRNPQFGFETYVLHMRTGSLVFVGGFDGPDDPAVAGVLRRLNSLKFNTAGGGTDPIGLLSVPKMTEVPHF